MVVNRAKAKNLNSFTNLRFVLLFVCFPLLFPESVKAECLSFLPHGYNGYFVHLPKNKKFCVNTPDGIVNYNTNDMGARIITGNDPSKIIYAFGESQLIEIFPNYNNFNHTLRNIYIKQNLNLHGAPNNGPNETLSFIKYVITNSKKKINNITISINLGFDLFRVLPAWKTQDKVTLKSNEIDFMMNYPKVYNLFNFGRLLLNNKIETINSEKQTYLNRNYFIKKEPEIKIYFEYWLENVKKLKDDYGLIVELLVFQPWWSYDTGNIEDVAVLNKKFERKAKNIVCFSLKKHKKLFDNITYFDFNKKLKINKLFTYDLRHFIDRSPLVTSKPFKC